MVIVEKRLVNLSRVVGDGRVFAIPAAAAAETLGKKVLMNIVMLGSMVALASPHTLEPLKKAVAERFPKAAELNVKALDAGVELSEQAKNGGIEALV